MKKRVFAMLLVCVLVVGLVPVRARAAGATQFAGGDGSAENPYQVATAEQLSAIRFYLDSCYIQVADIDLQGIDWLPIGYSTSYSEEAEIFSGRYDGGGHSVSNMTILKTFTNTDNAYREVDIGLFARNSGEIRNVSLKNCKISIEVGEDIEGESLYLCVGGVVARSNANKESALDKCLVTGGINIENLYNGCIGGIAGTSQGCKNAVNFVNIHVESTDRYNYRGGDTHCGGIAGYGHRTENCLNYGTIEASGHGYLECGGIVGAGIPVNNCTNYGDVSGRILLYTGWRTYNAHCEVGGVIGEAVGKTRDAVVDDCFNYGNVTASSVEHTSNYVGGIVGSFSFWEGNIANCYNLGERIDGENVGRISGCSFGSYSESLYSLDTTLVNGEIPTEGIGESDKNGQSLSLAEIKARVPNNGYWPSSWAEAEVNSARDNGLIPESLDGNYTGNITRAEFCRLGVALVKSLGKENQVFSKITVVLNGKRFTDTDDADVLAMCDAGIVKGYSGNRFGPDDPITREQAAVMLARLARAVGKNEADIKNTGFRDGDKISSWAKEDVQFIAGVRTQGGKAVMGGTGGGNFSPKSNYTREQAFITFQRLYDAIKNPYVAAGADGSLPAKPDLERGEQDMAQRAVELVQKLAKLIKQEEEEPFRDKDAELEKLKKHMTAHGMRQEEIPEQVYQAFAMAIYDTLDTHVIKELESDPVKLANQVYDAIKDVNVAGETYETLTLNGKKTEFYVNYEIMNAPKFLENAAAHVSGGTVTWDGKSVKILSTDNEDMKKALAAYCTALAKLNTEVWKDFLAAYFADAFGLMKIDVKSKDVKNALDTAEKVINALNDRNEAKKLVEECFKDTNQAFRDQLLGKWFKNPLANGFVDYIEKALPQGKTIKAGAKCYEKVQKTFEKWREADYAGKDGATLSELYEAFNDAITDLDKLLEEMG